MKSRPTDHKNLDLLELNRQVINGTSGGKIIWQPRIACWITDKTYKNIPFPAPYTGMSKHEIYRELGCSDRLYPELDYYPLNCTYTDSSIVEYTKRISEFDIEHGFETPKGKIFEVIHQNDSNGGMYPSKHLVETEEELKIYMYMLSKQEWHYNQEIFNKLKEEGGDLGLPAIITYRVPPQTLCQGIMSVQNGIYAMFDYPDTVEDFFKLHEEDCMNMYKVLVKSDYEWVNMGDNMHGGVLPPNLFEKYALEPYQKRTKFLKDNGLFVSSHWDGDVKPLLPFAQQTGLSGIEAITPLPQGDVTIPEVKEALGDMFLLDGIAAIMFDPKLYTVGELVDQTKQVIDAFAPNLILGISDEISSTGDLDRVKLVGQIVDEYNAKVSGLENDYDIFEKIAEDKLREIKESYKK